MSSEPAGTRGILLSSRQEDLWFRHQLEEREAERNNQWVFLLRGPLDPPRLAAAIHRLVEHQGTFRAAFQPSKGFPRQQIKEWPPGRAPVLLHHVDLRGVAVGPARRHLRELRRRLLELPFDLSRPPLLRALSASLGPRHSRLFVTFPRLVADDLSRPTFLRALAVAYGACGSAPEARAAAPLPIQVAELALHEAVALAAPETQLRMRRWGRRLGKGSAAPLGRDRPRSASAPSPRLSSFSFSLPSSARRILAALAALLGRWSGRRRVCLASLVEHRPPGAEEVVGPLGNLVPLPTTPEPRSSFASLESSCRDLLEESRKLAAVPFDRWTGRRRDEEIRLAQIFLRWSPWRPRSPRSGELHLREAALMETGDWPAVSEVGFFFDLEGGMSRCVFDGNLFDGVTLRRLTDQLRRLLEDALADPERALEDLRWSSPGERHQVLHEWSGAGGPQGRGGGEEPGEDLSLAEAFRRSAATNGRATAILVGHRRTSYRDLESYSGALARWLRALGARPTLRVGLAVRNPRIFALGVVAVARLGATLVPLDVRLCRRRLREAIQGAGLCCLVTDEASEAELPPLSLPKVVASFDGLPLGGGGRCVATPSEAPALLHLEAGGDPGAVYSHRGLLEWSRGRGLGAVAGLGELSSEAAFLSLWSALQQGRCWVGVPGEELTRPEALEELFARCWIGMAFVAEEVSAALAAARSPLLEHIPQRRFPETAAAASAARPVYLLDRRLEPVTAGGTGWIWRGGEALPQSFGNDRRRTARELVPDPFSFRPGARLMATGERGGWTATGSWVPRTPPAPGSSGGPSPSAPGEIEDHLRRHGSVLDCRIQVEPDAAGRGVLIAKVIRGFARFRPGTGPWTELRGIPDPCRDELRNLSEGRVLEVGGGSLRTAQQLAPKAARYLYKAAPGSLSAREIPFDARDSSRPALEVVERAVEDFEGLEEEGFDLVLLSDLVPHLPGSRALEDVLAKAARVLAPGGIVCLSQVPCLWHAVGRVVRDLAEGRDAAMPLEDLDEQAQSRAARWDSLFLAPPYFSELLSVMPQWDGLRILPPRSRPAADAFDVLLRRRGGARRGRPKRGSGTVWADWRSGGLTLSSLSAHLEECRPPALGLTGLRSSPWQEARLWARRLEALQAEPGARVGDLEKAVAQRRSEATGAVARILEVARTHGYRGRLSWGRSGSDELLDLYLEPSAEPIGIDELWLGPAAGAAARLVHEPSSGFERRLSRRLSEHLRRELPAARLPARFDFVTTLPVRSAPRPTRGSGRSPRGVTETLIASLWREALGIDDCSAEDDFFLLGGGSRSAVRVVMTLRESFGVEIPIQAIFEGPTVAALAARIDELVEEKLERVLAEAPLPAPPPTDGESEAGRGAQGPTLFLLL